VEDIYEEFDRQPIAAASLGQVHHNTFMFSVPKPGRAHAYYLMEFTIQGPCLYRACRGKPSSYFIPTLSASHVKSHSEPRSSPCGPRRGGRNRWEVSSCQLLRCVIAPVMDSEELLAVPAAVADGVILPCGHSLCDVSLIAKYIMSVSCKCVNLFLKIFWLGALKPRGVLPGASGASRWAEGGRQSPAAGAERPFRH
jgi:hypothetical protein